MDRRHWLAEVRDPLHDQRQAARFSQTNFQVQASFDDLVQEL